MSRQGGRHDEMGAGGPAPLWPRLPHGVTRKLRVFELPRTWPFVGRGEEMAFVAKAFGRGDIAGVVLVGDAGVGKSRLGLEAVKHANGRGLATTWVAGARAAIPFGPFAHLIPDASRHPHGNLGLLREITDQLAEQAQVRRLVVGIDDAHLLDEASGALIHHLATSATAFVIVTQRAGEVAPDPIVALWKDGIADRLEVQALSQAHVQELVPQILGGQVDGPTLAMLWEWTRGNVLFLRELILAAASFGALSCRGEVWGWSGEVPLSSRLQEVILAHLGPLEAGEASLLEMLALGGPTAAGALERIFPRTALEAAERRGIVLVETTGRR